MPPGTFHLPIWFDLGATFAFSLTGAIVAIKRGYDIVGIFFIALATGLGGALIRDGVFIKTPGPTPLLSDPRYLETVAAAAIVGGVFGFGFKVRHFHRVVAVIDALGLGAYAVFGFQKSTGAGLSIPAALLVGVINAAGGGLLRDLLTGEVPLVFKPGQFYVLIAFAGEVAFVFCTQVLGLAPTRAGVIAIAFTFVFRVLTITFNWRTTPFASTPSLPPSAEPPASG